ncbi:styrene monooxygenase/indole monooxygenase family protein [Cylindrospermum sp. FACHB-282]|uniref:styrene monooxygenase/indole monooxygenase family protein n=1 Tax=Cylindrospermum sp. FACHB-282 TaxID=2692794 RepID=UPI001682BDBF|nr:styrene monooxygenase/indole monooxygenase family protein [Cylindrospermum sp. FACHB-282]MBD2386062.1 oxygenase [Cylindrospermum sp. FACHB-282]
MRRIGIIGAGQAGLYLGISLLEAGYRVTLFSEYTPEAILASKPISTTMLMPDALELERNLGLNFWDDDSPSCEEIHSNISDADGNLILVMSNILEKPWQAVDQRLKFSRWMQEFVCRGGELVIQKMTPLELDQCAPNYDLVLVSVGKGSLSSLFEQDVQKSDHDKPKRHIAGGIFTGLKEDFSAFKVTNIFGVGEIMLFPFYHKDKKPAFAVGFEAYPGGVMDRFLGVQSGQELLELSKQVIQELTPWNYEIVENMELTDDKDWLCGAITPTVRHAIAHLPSGATVMGIADTVILHDPIAAQGGNNALKMAHLVTQRMIEHGNLKFDESWMQAVFAEFWEYAQYANALADCLLTPTPFLQNILAAMAENPEIARDYFQGFNHPPSLFPWFFDAEECQKYLARKNSRTVESNYVAIL